MLRRAHCGNLARHGAADARTLRSAHALAEALLAQGRVNAAEPLLRELAAAAEAAHGPNDARTLASVTTLAKALARRANGGGGDSGGDGDGGNGGGARPASGDLTEAEALLRRVLAANEAALGPADSRTTLVAYGLAKVLAAAAAAAGTAEALAEKGGQEAAAQAEEAEALLRRVLASNDAAGLASTDVRTLNALHALGDLLVAALEGSRRCGAQSDGGQGEIEAVSVLRRAVDGRSARLGDGHADTRASRALLARALGAQKRMPQDDAAAAKSAESAAEAAEADSANSELPKVPPSPSKSWTTQPT